MLKKEFLDASKRLLECLLILVAIPVSFVWDKVVIKFGWEFSEIFIGTFITIVVIFSVYSGATIFQSEKKDRAFEYLLSLPISRLRIIINKILPRISILLFLIIILASFSGFKLLLTNGVTFLFLFLISVFISITVNSVIIGLLGVLLLYYVFFFTSRIISFLSWQLHINITGLFGFMLGQLIPAALLLIPFGIAFWLTFKNFDMKPLKLQIKPYYYIALPSLIIIISFIVRFFGDYLSWR